MHTVGIIRGDGIGPEVSEAAVRVVEASGVVIRWEEIEIGSQAKLRMGSELPWASLQKLRELKVALKAPLLAHRCSGGVAVEEAGQVRRHPSINNGLRRELDLFVNVRPVRGWPKISGSHHPMNLIILREISEDLYIGLERQVDADTAEATKRITRPASRRVAKFACDYALSHDRRKITAVHKANVLHLTDGLFLECVRSVVGDFPQLAFEDQMVDAACYHLVKQPDRFDVMVLPNQYGDIVSDLAASLAGSLGLAPGANLGEEVALFEAAHGAAPDIAGQGKANPIALILSAALLLDHVGEGQAAERIRQAVDVALTNSDLLTPDLGGPATTSQLTQAICQRIQNA
jgi:isocitrate dehydrogenase (NAD+)